jgi:hypothetical protein
MKGRGDQKVFILFTPTLALPPAYRQAGIEGGGDYSGDLKYLLLIFTVHTIMD